MNWYIIYISCYLLSHVILNLKRVYQAFLSCIKPPTIFVHPMWKSTLMSHISNWPILHDKQPPYYPHLWTFIPNNVITTAPILLILNLGVYISWRLKSCNFINSSLNSWELFHLCDAVSHLQHDFQLVCPKWDLKNEGGPFQLHL
jgi:hypothetical protein